MKPQREDEILIDPNEIARDRELNNLWNKFCECEEKDLEDEMYKIAEEINKRLQDLFNRHSIDIVDYLWDFPVEDVKDIVKTFAEKNTFTCNDCGAKFYFDDDKKPVHIKDEKQKTGYRKKIGRNEQCPCGSGKKYKKCCGKLG